MVLVDSPPQIDTEAKLAVRGADLVLVPVQPSPPDLWAAEATLMAKRWHEELGRDPYYSPNMSLDQLQLWEPAFPPRVSYPWRREQPV